jgi:cytochrome c oxidase assembly protein subunit 15
MHRWLFGTAGLTLGMVAVGGMTRLTESGLSITEWKPVTGMVPPLNRTSWESEFDRYKAFPEYQRLRRDRPMSLDEACLCLRPLLL